MCTSGSPCTSARRERRPPPSSGSSTASFAAFGLILFGVVPWPAHGETLAEAIAYAYQSNPTLQAQRAQLRASDEGYVQARSAYGPNVQIQATASYNDDRLRRSFINGTSLPDSHPKSNLGSAQVVVDQPLYSGGRTTLEVQGAEQRIRAAREALRAVEQNVVFSVIQSYLDVRRDAQALEIRRVNLEALKLQLKETAARRRGGEVTLTDEAQAEAQLYAEEANLALAENQLRVSQAAYTTAVGHNPGALAAEPPLPGLPVTAELAFDLAAAVSPEFRQALLTEEASRTNVQIARTEQRPTVSLRGSYGYSSTIDPFNERNRDRALTGLATLSIPIFTSGRTSSQIRQALDVNTSDRLSIEATRRSMVQNVANAWNQKVTYTANIGRNEAQVQAAELAFRGMRLEYRAGERSTLDVLIAQQTLTEAELNRLFSRHDAYIASALVLRYIGRLDARDIVEGIPAHDPAQHYRRVMNKGALPLEYVVKRIDGILLPSSGQRSIPAPDEAAIPQMAAPLEATSEEPVTKLPATPVAGTVSNGHLPRLEHEQEGPHGGNKL